MQSDPYQTPVSRISPETGRWLPSISQILFSFEGRIRRSTYWLSLLGLMFSGGIFTYAIDFTGLDALPEPTQLLSLLSFLYGIAVLWASFAVQTKRWHDRNKSGWWCLIHLIPVIGSIWSFIELGCLSGDDDANDFGPPQG